MRDAAAALERHLVRTEQRGHAHAVTHALANAAQHALLPAAPREHVPRPCQRHSVVRACSAR